MLDRYFARPDGALGLDALFGFLLGLGAVVAVSGSAAALEAVRVTARLGAGVMLLSTFVAGVALGRSVSRALGGR